MTDRLDTLAGPKEPPPSEEPIPEAEQVALAAEIETEAAALRAKYGIAPPAAAASTVVGQARIDEIRGGHVDSLPRERQRDMSAPDVDDIGRMLASILNGQPFSGPEEWRSTWDSLVDDVKTAPAGMVVDIPNEVPMAEPYRSTEETCMPDQTKTILAAPPKPPNQMTPEERKAWANALFDAMAGNEPNDESGGSPAE